MHRLPVLIVVLLVGVAAVISWGAYTQVRGAVIEATAAHLESSAREIADLLQASTRRLRRDMADLAAHPAIREVIEQRGRRGLAADSAIAALRKTAPQWTSVAIRSRGGVVLRSSGTDSAASADPTANGESITHFVSVRDTLVYGVLAPVLGPRHDTLGFVVGTRRLADGGLTTINRVLGADARLMLGNANGTAWTNLAGPTEPPPLDSGVSRHTNYVASDGRRYIGIGARVAGTPWLVWVAMPHGPALASIRDFLWRIVVFGAISVIIGGLGMFAIVRGAVRPVSGELLERAERLEQSNRALLASERRYRQLIDQCPDAIIVHRDARILFANSIAAKMLGAPNAEALRGQPLLDRVDPADRELVESRIAAIAATGAPAPPAELRVLRMDGTPLSVEVTGTAAEFDGEPAVQTWARDISARQQLEAQLRQSQKMEAIGRLAGGVAHDFNNLLSVIRTYAELTLASMSPDDPNRPGIEDIKHAAMSAAQLTRQMLAFSRKQVLNPQVLYLNEAISAMTAMLHRTLGDHVEVVTNLRGNLAPIWADASQLEQVLVNLAVNARDAMPDGGTIRIETANVTLSEGYASHRGEPIPPGDYVMLAVSDTGVGMTPEVKANIFEPFFTTKHSLGTGLGLATVYGIVKQSGGHIWVYSEPGQGTSFKLYFPQHGEPEQAPPKPPEEPVRAASRTASVLLVEDDAHVRVALCRTLERADLRIAECASGDEALDIYRRQQGRFDLVITDMMMPNMTGAELIHELREMNPSLRAIIMSGYSEETTTREWRLPPNTAFIEKPISPSHLLRVIDDVLAAPEALTSPSGPAATTTG